MNKIKLIVRILLPLLVFLIYKGYDWLYKLVVYGGYDQMLRKGIITDGMDRANHLIFVVIIFFLPLIILFHALFCWLNKKYSFINLRFGIFISVILTIRSCIVYWKPTLNENLVILTESVFLIFPPILLYFYLLNLTKSIDNFDKD